MSKKYLYEQAEPEEMMLNERPDPSGQGLYVDMVRTTLAEEEKREQAERQQSLTSEQAYYQHLLNTFPEDNGEPLSDNTLHFEYILKLSIYTKSYYADDPNVFVAVNLLWYPLEDRYISPYSPDVMVVKGRPKRTGKMVRVYYQWLEGDIPPQVVFEIIWPCNTKMEMRKKFNFYQTYGVLEYFVINPSERTIEVWVRVGEELILVADLNQWKSPLIGISFVIEEGKMISMNGGDGTPILDPLKTEQAQATAQAWIEAEKGRAEAEQVSVESEKNRIEAEKGRAEAEKGRAEAEKAHVESEKNRTESEKNRIEAEKGRAEAEKAQAETQARYELLLAGLANRGISLEDQPL